MKKPTKKEIEILRDFFSKKRTKVSTEQQTALLPIYNKLHPEKMYKHNQCASCWREIIGKLAVAFNDSEKVLVKKPQQEIKSNIKKANRRRKTTNTAKKPSKK